MNLCVLCGRLLCNRAIWAKTGDDKTVTERQIDATDRHIDRLVYDSTG